MKTLDGKVVDLKDQVKSGQVTVIVFWATWCAPCKKELVNIDELYEDWKDDYGIEVIAISIDNSRNATKVKPYINGKGWEFPVLIDVNSNSKALFNYPTVPFSALIDKNKRIVYTHNGYVEGDEYNLEKHIKELVGK
ncbi:MAG: TlpA family protein disulfide reductase [Bacteroidetes bacterium]|nr:TlpA family protein disulfide reductase [Bacteroidota bacterium]